LLGLLISGYVRIVQVSSG